MHKCPVCEFANMPWPANSYNICPCCGTEFGNYDDGVSHAELRRQWIANGSHWFFKDLEHLKYASEEEKVTN